MLKENSGGPRAFSVTWASAQEQVSRCVPTTWASVREQARRRWKVLLVLLLLVLLIRHVYESANRGVDGSNFANAMVQCVYRSFRYTGNFQVRLTDPYDDKLLSCDEDHQYSMMHEKYPTDKCGRHTYLPKYEPRFRKIRDSGKRVSLLEVGVKNGGSLMLWRAYFPFDSRIYGLDINQGAPQFQHEPAIKILHGDSKEASFDYFDTECLDIIIDDGDHALTAQLHTFSIWFDKYLCPGGVFVVEDVLDNNRKGLLSKVLTRLELEFEAYGDPSGESMFMVYKPSASPWKWKSKVLLVACQLVQLGEICEKYVDLRWDATSSSSSPSSS